MSLVRGHRAASGGPQSQQERSYGLFGQQGDLITSDLNRNPGRNEGPAQSGNGQLARSHEHRHLRPRQAVSQTGAPQHLANVLGLGTSTGAGVDLHGAARQSGSSGGVAEGGQDVRRQRATQGQPVGDVAAGRQ